MSLIANYDGNASTHLFTTWNSGGNHTGTPANGNEVQVWQDVGTSNPSGGNNRALIYPSTTGQSPTYASPGSMLLPSITFNGSADVMQAFNNSGSTPTSLHTYSPPGGWSIIGSFRLAAAATNNANIWDNTSLYMDNSQTFGLVFKTISSVHYVHAYSYDSNADVTTGMAISLNTDYVFCARLYSGARIDLRIFSGTGGATTDYQNVGTGTNSGSGSNAIYVGRNGPGSAYFNGVIGEISFYNTDEAFLDSSGNLNAGTALNDMIGKWLPAAAGGSVPNFVHHYMQQRAA